MSCVQVLSPGPVAHQLMFMPQWDPNAESLVTGPSQDDHDGGPAAGVAYGSDPAAGEPMYQFGNQWVSSFSHSQTCKAVFSYESLIPLAWVAVDLSGTSSRGTKDTNERRGLGGWSKGSHVRNGRSGREMRIIYVCI